jgi:hypothetical protein
MSETHLPSKRYRPIRRKAMKEVFDEPSETQTNHGIVIVEGPDSVDVALTPKAALRTAERISAAAVEALVEQADALSKDKH